MIKENQVKKITWTPYPLTTFEQECLQGGHVNALAFSFQLQTKASPGIRKALWNKISITLLEFNLYGSAHMHHALYFTSNE